MPSNSIEYAGVIYVNPPRGYRAIHWGKLVPGLRERMSEAQNHRCCYCGGRMHGSGDDMATFEHIIALSAGGEDHPDNMAIARQKCNILQSLKGNLDT